MTSGKALVKVLDEFQINIGAVTKHHWKKRRDISPTVLRNAFKKIQSQTLHRAIEPIAEFHYLDHYHGANVDSFAKRLNDKKMVRSLQDQKGGIYAFFDLTGSIIYVGKTTGNLFTEMQQRYLGKRIRFRVLKKNKAAWESWPTKDIAQFVSAYRVHDLLVTNVEALLTRLIINEASNIRIESFRFGVS